MVINVSANLNWFRCRSCCFHYVKVVGVTEEIIQFGSDLVLHYKKLEVIEEIGWWLDRFYVNMFPGSGLYEDVKSGDRLFLRVSLTLFQSNC